MQYRREQRGNAKHLPAPKPSLLSSQESATGPHPQPHESSSHPASLRPILILYSYLRLTRPSGLLLSGLPTKILNQFLLTATYTSHPRHSRYFDHPNKTSEAVQNTVVSSIFLLLLPPRCNRIFSNTLSLFFLIILSGVRLGPLCTAATTALLYQPQMIDDDCAAIVGMMIGGRNRSTWRKPAPVPLCPPQTPHDLTWARTWAAAVGSQRLTA
jgi:hypothetical protein